MARGVRPRRPVVQSKRFKGADFQLTVPSLALTSLGWDINNDGTFDITGVEEGNVLGGLIIIPVIDVVAPLPTGLEGMVMLMGTSQPGRGFGFIIDWS